MAIKSAYHLVCKAFCAAWGLRIAFFLTNVTLAILTIAILSPLTAGLVHVALWFSGEPALADQDIAAFIFSPVGLVALFVIASVLIVRAVLGTAVMMALTLSDEKNFADRIASSLHQITSRIAVLFGFAVRLFLRIVLISVPFLALAVVIAKHNLTEFDINYYLSNKPPEALLAISLIVFTLMVLAVILVNRLLNWYLSLSLILFQEANPASVFSSSAEKMQGMKIKVLQRMAIWGLVTVLAWFILTGTVSGVSNFVLPMVSTNLVVIVGVIAVLLLFWAVINAFIGSLAGGSFSILMLDVAKECGLSLALPGNARSPLHVFRRRLPKVATTIAVIIAGAIFAGSFTLSRMQTKDDIEIIAHRGAAGRAPENTLASIQAAIDDGADWIEIDVQESADGEVVVIHDSDFMKIAGVNLKIWDANLPDLDSIDIGSWFDPAFSSERTPRLQDVLEVAKGRAKVLIELKYYGHNDRLEQRVADIVESAEMTESIAVMSLKNKMVKTMKEIRPEWRTGLLAATAVGDVTRFDVDFVAVSSHMASQNLVKRADKAGQDVYVWTINDPLSMSRMISTGVDGLITDEPAMARQVIAQRAELSSPERLLLWAADFFGIDLVDKTYRDSSP